MIKNRFFSIILFLSIILTACNYDESVLTDTEETTYVEKGMDKETVTVVEKKEEIDYETESDNTDKIEQKKILNLISMDKERNSFSEVVEALGGYERDKYIGSFLIDIDCDGKNEAFVYYYSVDSYSLCDLWLVYNSEKAEKLSEIEMIFDETELEGVYSYQYGNEVLVICNWADSVTSAASDLFLFQKGKMISKEDTPFRGSSHGYKRILENGDIEVIEDYYGFLIEWKEDQKKSEGMQLGHAYIPYIFKYKDGILNEYKAVEINLDEEDYIWDKKPFKEKDYSKIQFLKRENNEIDVNVACEDNLSVSFHAYRYQIEEDGKTLSLIEELDGTIGKEMEDFSFQEQFMYE